MIGFSNAYFRSSICIKKFNGPRVEPCGMPQRTFFTDVINKCIVETQFFSDLSKKFETTGFLYL